MTDETIGAPGGPDSEEAGSAGRAPEDAEGSGQGNPHTSTTGGGHPAGEGERSDRDVGGPTAPDREPEKDETGGAHGTRGSGFEPDSE